MSKSFEEFYHKVKNREFAIANSWRADNCIWNDTERSIGADKPVRWAELEENLSEADKNHYIDEFAPLYTPQTGLKAVTRFIKRCLHKILKILFGWFMFPMLKQQNCFNGKLLNAVSLEREILLQIKERTDTLSDRIDSLSRIEEKTNALSDRIDSLSRIEEKTNALSERINNLSQITEQVVNALSESTDSLAQLTDQVDSLSEDVEFLVRKKEKEEKNLMIMSDEFYHDFEEHFRGSRKEIINRLQVYVPKLQGYIPDWSQARFIDIGSGRGEWLDVLKDHDAKDYIGVDINQRQNQICMELGHTVCCRDCLEYLTEQKDNSVDVITGFQIVEHLPMGILCSLLEQCQRVLKQGGIILFETQNPRNLIVGADTFYIDPSHVRPLEPVFFQYLAEHYGFGKIEIIEENSAGFQALSGSEENLNKLVSAINDVNWRLFGPQDYAILAVKE